MPRLLIAQAANASHVRKNTIAPQASRYHANKENIAQEAVPLLKIAQRDIIVLLVQAGKQTAQQGLIVRMEIWIVPQNAK
jgi:hypothetical protein